MGSIDFYDPKHLKELLDGIARLELTRPVFVKMPISKTDQDVLSIMEVVSTYPYIKGVIIGNLQKNRDTPGLVPEEVARFQTGNFSGLPCKERSNELIELVYKKYGSQMTVIGCGGVFTAEDAYEKIKLGASLVQLITGLIYEGPGLVAEINTGIDTLLARDGYQHISDAIGVLTHDE
jgi:dihydroorotate dehydrogenase